MRRIGPACPTVQYALVHRLPAHVARTCSPQLTSLTNGLTRTYLIRTAARPGPLPHSLVSTCSPAAHMVLHYLASWGAPPALLAAMRPPEGRPFAEARSRPLLLALGWLAAAAGLFERPIRDREPQPDVRALLPPYPEVR